MSLKDVVRIAASGLEAQRARMETVASNLANTSTTRTPEGGPYRRRMPVIAAQPVEKSFENELQGAVRKVEVRGVLIDQRPPILRYEPGHPDANPQGYVAYPNIDAAEEMVDMLSATRSYEANINVIKTVRTMNEAALTMVR